jgi:hypothetical protein
MTTMTRTNSDGQTRKTLASQIDRLDGILDGLDAALAGAVREAVEAAVKEAVRAVLAEVLTNRPLQEQLQGAADQAGAGTEDRPGGRKGRLLRLWEATAENVRRAARTVKEVGARVGGRAWLALLAAGGVVAGFVYASRKKIVASACAVCRHGKALVGKAGAALARLVPTFALGGT